MTAHRMAGLLVLVALATLALVPSTARSEEEAVRVVVPVERIEREATLDVEGRLRPGRRTGVSHQPRAYTGAWTVVHAAEPGTVVRRDEAFLEFDREEIEIALDHAERAIEQAERRLRILQERHALARHRAEDDGRRAEKELRDAARRLEDWTERELGLAGEKRRLDDEQWKMGITDIEEELAELEKLYDEDELVEATEELVLARTRRRLAHRRASYEMWRARGELQREAEARRTQELRMDLELRERALERLRHGSTLDQADRAMAIDSAELAFRDRRRQLDRLRHDLEACRAVAPHDGVLLYGDDVLGADAPEPGSRLDPRRPFAFVIDPSDLVVALRVPATRLLSLEPGQPARVLPKIEGAATLDGRVERIGLLVGDDGKVAVECGLRLEGRVPGAVPGAACSVKIRTGLEEVLVVPAAAVTRADGKATVRVPADGEPGIREVKVGEEIDGRLVVLEGLEEGERVVVEDGR